MRRELYEEVVEEESETLRKKVTEIEAELEKYTNEALRLQKALKDWENLLSEREHREIMLNGA